METGSADKRIWTWVSEDGKHAAAGMCPGSAGTKPGGGGEEQPYDDHGRYLGTVGQGGVSGGISGGSEVRGKVTKPKEEAQKVPTTVIWKNAEEAHGLKPQMQDAVQSMRRDVSKLDSVLISSGRREPLGAGDPHAEGRAVDLGRINGIPVAGLETSTAPGADRAREAARNLGDWAKENPDVNQFIGPKGGWNKDGKGNITPLAPAKQKVLLDGHKDHIHINVFRK
ncbi:MAG: hypothetical protein HY916_02460 [Desulfovibrio sp.]|jgi:hypothetical protein|nr:hypothetical protein [Desulfovibrio sp.]